jgi:PAS domain-containing protein
MILGVMILPSPNKEAVMDQTTPERASVDILAFPPMLSPLSYSDEALLLTVLNNLPQGVLLFDSQTRLILCNTRYLEMYGLPAEAALAGCYLRELLALRILSRALAQMHWHVRIGSILLKKSEYQWDKKFLASWARFRCTDVGDLIFRSSTNVASSKWICPGNLSRLKISISF